MTNSEASITKLFTALFAMVMLSSALVSTASNSQQAASGLVFAKPASITFGATVNQMQKVLRDLCRTQETRRIDPPFLDGVKDRQMQIDCEGFMFRGKPRHAEFVFGDDDLKMVWVMTAPQERHALEKAMKRAYGTPSHVNANYVGFIASRVALRLDRAEVLFYSQAAEGDVLPDITALP